MMGLRFCPNTGLPLIHDPVNGVDRLLAFYPTPDNGQHPLFGVDAGTPLIDIKDWQEVNYSYFSCPLLDQGRQGSCGGHGSCTAFTRGWITDGRPLYRFSPCFIYGNVNGGVDNGSNIGDLMTSLKTTGVCLESEVGPGNIYKRNFPPQAYQTAKRFRIDEAYRCNSFESIVSSVLKGYATVIGIMVGEDFSDLDSGGVAPVPTQNNIAGGHALEVHAVKKVVSGKFKGRWALEFQNSWGRWGINNSGMGLLVEEHFHNYCEGYAIIVAKEDPNMPTGVVAIG